ncbi:MAG: 3-phosphoserine/phosphohydroxythreonine transaminase [Bacteroidetes bacterium]|jgi:phosphoserine aminotransferase|nr:3-phosphoserine/phosphohydroxythreonine transaminase [Bacteroidota bacterium]MDA1019231.1 3-phosphoserine/phosphohydroxythreonine transaminase [Bacteroidota bacterium]|tara:strand:+ start:66323 stop:67387 length:1065 start_codon:yes stop_codon:yes gene_type:complete
MKVHNFSAGPSILPDSVIKEASNGILNINNSGLSLLEISHRSKDFIEIMDKATSLALKLLDLENKGYKALFLQGGASNQFLMTAYNLLENKAGYLNTGVWSSKALKEAKIFGEAIEIASSKDKNFNYIPKGYSIDPDLDYFHITTNNTIFGTQIKEIPNTSVNLVADMSSDIFSRKIDFSKFGLIYAGAQKNMGPAGTTLVVIKEDILGKVSRDIPSMLDYKVHIDKESMFNTPPVFAVYTSMLTLKWIDNNGGIENIESKNNEKAQLLYNAIDNNELFKGFAAKEDRSTMNATFNLVNQDHKEVFDKLSKEANINGINGHISVGGYRASIYNALEIESVKVLIEVMNELKRKV